MARGWKVEAVDNRFEHMLGRFAMIRPGEARAVAWSFAYFFALLAAYYVLRPLRDQMGIAGGVRNLPWLFTATFLAMLAAQPAYGALVARFARARFIPVVYHFFVINIAIFWLLLTFKIAPVRVAQVFFVWISVFNLFAVSVFWSFMADLYKSGQGKRLFGLIGAGGTAGALLGPMIALWLAGPLGPVNLLIIAGALLELAVFCVLRLEKTAARLEAASGEQPMAHQSPTAEARERKLGGSWLAGIAQLFVSPYLAGIALWVSLLSFGGTILYLEQAHLVAAAAHNAAAQTRIFASIDLAVGIMSLALQALASGRLIARFGVATAVAFQPAVFVLGFAALALAPSLAVVVAFQAIQRTANFAVSNLGRQILFTTVTREEKYKGKNVIDVVVFRGSDALYGWVFAVLRSLGLGLAGIAGIAVPLALGWLGLAVLLGRVQERRAAAARMIRDEWEG
ncbi:MAG TPA: MFS transporter [Alphaproteobacteria bacterium]|nr:MFS transporter [Alphaproteobacteria bacterium]